jgi:hypothetical protein
MAYDTSRSANSSVSFMTVLDLDVTIAALADDGDAYIG